ncbi:MAG: TRAP transporter substrate-binding protein DctP [Desulfobulbaceae bacterium]|nr:TRAP transporter substrate-binding protein DctP [Desulfobulbaceae bacterium]
MRSFGKTAQLLTFLATILLVASSSQARPTHLFKVASLAPDGSIWATRFNDFAQEVLSKSNGEVGFKAYPGGVMGDDRAMYRKMQIGQLHGGGFTMIGIGEVVPDFRVLGIPCLFNSYEEVDQLSPKLIPRFQKAFSDKGLVLLSLTEVGFVHTMSTSPLSSLVELKKTRVWIPSGDPLNMIFLDTVGVVPIPLAIPDVLPSLQTGMIDTVFNSFYGAIVLQWFTKIQYISDLPFAYAYGAFVLDRKKFSRLSPEQADIVKNAAEKHFGLLINDSRKSNEESLQVLKDNGVEVVAAADGEKERLRAFYDIAVQKMTGTVFSREIFEESERLLAEIRAQAGNL